MSLEPQTRYALTEDGVSIAYWTYGEGMPFVLPPGGVGVPSLRVWRTDEGRDFIERLGTQRMIVRYDTRGFGNSQTGTVDLSLEARVRDMAAVVEKLGVQDVNLCGYMESAPAAIVYAAEHPARVARLVLWGASVHDTRYVGEETRALLERLADLDFELYREAYLTAVVRYLGREPRAYEFAASLREVMSGPVAVWPTFDVSDRLGSISSPTLVLHRRGLKSPPLSEVQMMAARIPNARLILLEGDSSSAYSGDTDSVLAAIDEFLGDGGDSVRPSRRDSGAAAQIGALRTVLFTDIVGHTEMMRRLGDQRGRDVLREHERITRETLKQHGGAEVKTMGDGFLASFGSVTRAMDCAIALQRAFAAWSGGSGAEGAQGAAEAPLLERPPLRVRVGLNAGEPIEEDGDLFGSTVILASRIAAHAGAGEILVPDTVRGLLSGKGYIFGDRGEFIPKGFDEGVRLWDVRWRE